MIWARILLTLSSTALTVILSVYYLHMLQLEGYFTNQYLHHLFARIRRPKLLFAPQKTKKPLHFTPRIIRLTVITTVLVLLYNLCFAFFCFDFLTLTLGFSSTVFCVLAPILASLWVLIASLIAKPLEKLIANAYINDAKKILSQRPDLKIVAITGSYGKTSTKFILSSILSEKYSVLTPPSSYNTTMGVVRVIRERLQPDDEVFICEMGSRHLGDIKEICDIVHPQKAIITSIGPQHLDTFGSVENVKKGKYELIQSLPDDGTAVFSSLNEDIKELFEKTNLKKYSAGFNETDSVRAENITVGCSGSAFTLVTNTGERKECFTCLLGKHNISNILVAAAIALDMGLTADQVARGISKIKPIEHRLQIVNRSPVTVIDDAFNSSPNGANAALDVLSAFTGRRIIVTPGFVELGKDQDRYHIELGKKIKECADIAILVGKKRTEKIVEGLDSFNGEIHTVTSLSEATGILQKISVAGDTVLFENDLPDNYNE